MQKRLRKTSSCAHQRNDGVSRKRAEIGFDTPIHKKGSPQAAFMILNAPSRDDYFTTFLPGKLAALAGVSERRETDCMMRLSLEAKIAI